MAGVESLDGEIQHVVTNIDGIVRLDGEFLHRIAEEEVFKMPLALEQRATITWGPWQSSSDTIRTGGLATVTIAAVIVATCPWVPAKGAAAAAGVIANAYESIEIRWKIRYGNDGTYQHYERETSFYGNGKRLYGPLKDKGKTRL